MQQSLFNVSTVFLLQMTLCDPDPQAVHTHLDKIHSVYEATVRGEDCLLLLVRLSLPSCHLTNVQLMFLIHVMKQTAYGKNAQAFFFYNTGT